MFGNLSLFRMINPGWGKADIWVFKAKNNGQQNFHIKFMNPGIGRIRTNYHLWHIYEYVQCAVHRAQSPRQS